MNLFQRRPLALFCALFAVASVCGAYLTLKHVQIHLLLALIAFFIVALLLAVPLLLRRFHPRLLTPALALLFVGLSFLQSLVCIERKLDLLSPFHEEKVSCTVHIKEQYSSASYLSTYLVELRELNDTPFQTNAMLSVPFDADLALGDTLKGDFLLRLTTAKAMEASYLLSDGILLELEAEEKQVSVIDHTKPDPLNLFLTNVRDTLADLICQQAEGEEGHLISSLFLNKRELLETQTKRDFRRTGTTHLLAISGMHLSVVILLTDLLLRIFGIDKKGRCFSVLLITFSYLTLTGFALSACRAFLMCCFVYLSWLFRSDNDAVTSLFFSLFFILALSPFSVYDIGMWMSVLAVLGILIAQQILSGWRDALRAKGMDKKKLRRLFSVLSAICISLVAELFILFPMWLVFDELSLVALPCGLLLSPLVTCVLFLTPFMLLFSFVQPLSFVLAKALYAIAHLILTVVSHASSFRGITVSLHHRFFSFFIPIFSVIMLILLVIKQKGKWQIPTVMGSALLSILLFLCVLRLPEGDRVAFDFFQQNDNALLLFSASEESVVCDVTSGSYSPIRQTQDLLLSRYSTEISAYIFTHYHTNHISSIARLFASAMVRNLYLPMPQTEKEQSIFRSLCSVAQTYGVTVRIYNRGASLSFGDLSLKISSEVYLKRSTHPTFYIEAEAYGKSLLYVGESAHEDRGLYNELCQKTKEADLLIFGIHGPVTKQDFSYPLGSGYVFLTDALLTNHMLLDKVPNATIVRDTTQISLFLTRNDKTEP